MSRLVCLGLAAALLAGCATYRAPALPLSATAEDRERAARCEAKAAQDARDDTPRYSWEKWIPGNVVELALVPLAYPLMAWQVKKDREATFAAEYQRCLNWAPIGQGATRGVWPRYRKLSLRDDSFTGPAWRCRRRHAVMPSWRGRCEDEER